MSSKAERTADAILYEPPSNKFRFGTAPFIIAIGTVIVVLVGLVCVVLILLFAKVDHRIFIATRSCSGDGFSTLHYNKSDSSGLVTLRFLKYKYMEDIQNDRMYNFHQAVEKCLEMNSTLWEILDGEDEWNGVIAMAREKDLTSIWLNGKVTGSCPDTREMCYEEEAERGEGVKVSWSTSWFAKYSRVYKPPKGGRDCLHVDKRTDELLWTTDYCNTTNAHWTLCTKRDCIHE